MLNHITLMGRLTRDPELRYTQSNTAVASFSLAVERDFGSKEERQTDFIDCVAWRRTGEFVSKYFQKGSLAVVSGRLQIREWTDKDNNKRRSAEVVVENIYFGESKKSAFASAGTAPGATPYGAGGNQNSKTDTGYTFGQSGSPFYDLDSGDGELPF